MSRTGEPTAAAVERQAREMARLHYKEELEFEKIAKRFGVSKTTVANRIAYARAKEIVKITVDSGCDDGLERQLRAIFKPIGFRIVNDASNLGDQAAMYFDQLLNAHEKEKPDQPWTVAIGGGTTIQSMVDALPPRERWLKLLPTMIYGRGPTLGEYVGPIMSLIELRRKSTNLDHASPLISQRNLGKTAEIYYASIPPFEEGMSAEDARDEIKRIVQTPMVESTLAQMRKANAIFTSISPIFDKKQGRESPETQLIKHDIRTVLDRVGLSKEGVLPPEIAGDLSYSFFNSSGIGNRNWQLFVCPTIDDYQEAARDLTRSVVLLASSPGKAAAVWAALSNGLVNMAILDRQTAERLIRINNKHH